MRLATDNEAYYTCSSTRTGGSNSRERYILQRLNDQYANSEWAGRVFEDFKGIVFAYAIMNKKDPSQMRIINNSPEWFTIYLEKNISSLTLLSFGLCAVWKIFSGKVMLSCQMVITWRVFSTKVSSMIFIRDRRFLCMTIWIILLSYPSSVLSILGLTLKNIGRIFYVSLFSYTRRHSICIVSISRKRMFSCRHVSAKSLNGSAPENVRRNFCYIVYCWAHR